MPRAVEAVEPVALHRLVGRRGARHDLRDRWGDSAATCADKGGHADLKELLGRGGLVRGARVPSVPPASAAGGETREEQGPE